MRSRRGGAGRTMGVSAMVAAAVLLAGAGPAVIGAGSAGASPGAASSARYAVTATVNVGNFPDGVAVDTTTHDVLVSNYSDSTLSTINEASNAVVRTQPVLGYHPVDVAVDDTHDEVGGGESAFTSRSA